MGFSDKMRESLGAEGARLEVRTPDDAVPRGSQATASVAIHGGTRSAAVVALQLRLVEARRHWTTSDGRQVAEADAMALADRSQLMPAWTRTVVHTWEVEVNREVEPGGSTSVEIAVAIPASCGVTSPACVITLNAQADIRGQIDPTGNGHLRISA